MEEHAPIHILTFDPGGTTGIARFMGSLLTNVGVTHSLPTIEQLIRSVPDSGVVIVESFTNSYFNRDPTTAAATIEIIGVIRFLVEKHLGTPPTFIRASAKRPFAQAARALLKAHKPKDTHYLEHHYDAVALGLAWLYQKYPEMKATAYGVSDILTITDTGMMPVVTKKHT